MFNLSAAKSNYVLGPIGDIFKAIEGGTTLGSFILTLIAIDHLLGSNSKKQDYIDWVNCNLKKLNSKYDGSSIYSIRCGLVHNYGPNRNIEESVKFSLYNNPGKEKIEHLQRKLIDGKDILFIERPTFIADTIFSICRYLKTADDQIFTSMLRLYGELDETEYEYLDTLLRNSFSDAPCIDYLRQEVKVLFSK